MLKVSFLTLMHGDDWWWPAWTFAHMSARTARSGTAL